MRKKPFNMHSESQHHTWTDEELSELEDESTWDWDSAQTHPASASTQRAIIHMRLDRDDFRHIALAANAEGLTLIEFMRRAVLERAALSRHSSSKDTRSAD